MSASHRWMIAPLAALALAGCGFRPMYAPTPTGDGPLGAIEVDLIDGKAGHVMRQELTRMLAAGDRTGEPRRLEVRLSERVNRLGIRIDESASRADLIVTARYTLYDAAGAQDLSGRLSTTVSFDIPASAFGEIAAQDDARERAGEVLAERLRTELALRLAERAPPPAS